MVLQRKGLVLFGLLILALGIAGTPVLAATITIGTGYPGGIEQAIQDAGPDGTVILQQGIYNQHDIYVPTSTTIRADTANGGNAANTKIDAQNADRVFSLEAGTSFVIDNLTLQDGVTTTAGGAISSYDADVTITSSSFINCRATGPGGYGGAISMGATDPGPPAELIITSSSFTDCWADGYGGGAIDSLYTTTTITSTDFTRCRYTGTGTGYYYGGGAVHAYQEALAITSSSFKDCTAAEGGAVKAESASTASIRFCRIFGTGNQVYNSGSTVIAADNWWGANAGPAGYTAGDMTTTSPWLVLGITANPAAITTAQTSTVRANLTYRNNNVNTAGGGVFVPDFVPATFAVTSGTGSVTPMGSFFSSGAGTTTFTPVSAGTSTVSATVDGQPVSVDIAVTTAPPVITVISPGIGSSAGGDSVTITGTGFVAGATVTFGGTPATGVSVGSATSITATTPAHAAGAVDIVVTNPDTLAGTLTNGFTFHDPPTVTGISPASGIITGGNSVTITGTGFVAGATVTFGGTPATMVSVGSATSITATTPAHAAGAVDIVVTNPDTLAGTLTNGFTFIGPPTVTSISPTSGIIAGGDSVTITGTGFVAGATVTFGGTPATGVSVGSATSITATTPAHAAGAVDIVVTNPDTQTGTLTNGFTFIGPPTVTGISPDNGSSEGGDSVTITGTGFVTGATVTFGGTSATDVNVGSATSITATTPAHAAGAVDIVVTNPDTQSGTLTNGFTYHDPPTVTGISPATGIIDGGDSVTITGTGFVAGATVTFGGTSATGVSVGSPTSITATTPAHAAGAVDIVVTNPDTLAGTLMNGFTFIGPPIVTGISPTSGSSVGGDSVTITGTGFVTGATVTFGGTPATGVSVDSPTSITATTPAHAAGAVDIVVTNPDTQTGTLTNGFTYHDPPTVTGISPTSGSSVGGDSVTITGTGFVNGATVTFGGTSATGVSVDSATSITATTPAHAAGAVDIVVTNPDTQTVTLTNGFTYVGPPTVTGISPDRGSSAGGDSVTITGTGFVTGATVTFGGTPATAVSIGSPTSITATTPAHAAGAVDIVVTNSDTQSGTLTNGFTYHDPPTVTGISPDSGSSAGGDSVTITGTGFVTGATVTFGGTSATGVSVDSPTSITATTPAHATGPVDIGVTNPNTLAGTLTNGFTYTGPPAVTGISPLSGIITGGDTVTITGTGFITGATVTFGGTPATIVSVGSPTSITATTPAHAAGAVDIVITNPDTLAGTLTNGFMYTAVPVTTTPTTATTVPYVPTLDTSGNDDGFPTITVSPSVTAEEPLPFTTVTVNIGGDSKAWQAIVTGTKVSGLIVTGTVQHGPGNNRTAPPGTVFQYFTLVPARYASITKAIINFTVPQSWMDENHIAPGSIALYHLTTNGWEELPARVLYTKDGTMYFSATSTGFSLFAITGRPAAATPATLATMQETVSASVQDQETIAVTTTRKPVVTKTTSPPAPAPQPAAPSPILNIILIIAAIGILATGGFMVRRWWIHRQNPALFREYD